MIRVEAPFPYPRTIKAYGELPDRVIEAPVFLSLIRPLPEILAQPGYMRIVAWEDYESLTREPRTGCEIETVLARDFECGAGRIPPAWQSVLFDAAAETIEDIFTIDREYLDLVPLSPFEIQHLHQESMRFDIPFDLCSEIDGWSWSGQRRLGLRREVELLRLP